MSQIGAALRHAPRLPGGALIVCSLHSTHTSACGWHTSFEAHIASSHELGGPPSGRGPASGRAPVVHTPLEEHVSLGPQSVGAVHRA